MPEMRLASTRLRQAGCTLTLLVATACHGLPPSSPVQPPSPAVRPSSAPSAARNPVTRSPVRTPPVTVEATSAPTSAWRRVEGPGFALDLPPDWAPYELSRNSLGPVLERFRENNQVLAAALGDPGAWEGLLLLALAPDGPSQFAGNLSLRRLPLDGARLHDLPRVAAALDEQYRQFGFTILVSDPNFVVGGRQAARLRYSYPANRVGDRPVTVWGDQYLVPTESDLWILTFSSEMEAGAPGASFGDILQTLRIE